MQEGSTLMLAILVKEASQAAYSIKILDIANGEIIKQRKFDQSIIDFHISPENTAILIQEKNSLSLWHPRTGELEALIVSPNEVEHVAFCKDGRSFFYSFQQFVSQYHIQERKELILFEASQSPITCLSCNYKGDQLLVMDKKGEIKSWEIENIPQPTSSLDLRLIHASFSKDSSKLLLMSHDQLQVYEVSTGHFLSKQALANSQDFNTKVENLKEANESIKFTLGKPQAYEKGIHFLNSATGQEIHKIEEEGTFDQVLLSPDGRNLLAIREKGSAVYVWELSYHDKTMSSRLLWRMPPRLNFTNTRMHAKGVLPEEDDLSPRNRLLLTELGAQLKP